jgi:lipopolysaccharide export system protein LptA
LILAKDWAMDSRSFRILISIAVFALLCATEGFAQPSKSKVEILHADVWKFDSKVSDMQRLIGNVRLRQGETLMFCDSAWMYDDQSRFEAFSKVRIEKGDSIRISGDRLIFDNEERVARMRKNIRMTDKKMILTTNHLDYHLDNETGSYLAGGTITSTSGDVLKSREGVYYAQSGVFHFRKNVSLTNTDYTVTCDTLQYNERTSVSRFLGPTNIITKDSRIYCERGRYNSNTEDSEFVRNARITSEDNVLRGDSISYRGKLRQGFAFGNVEISDTARTFIITGEKGFHDEKSELTRMTQKALLMRPFEDDTLHLHADTLLTRPDSAGNKRIFAYPGVRFYKKNMQGRADSLVYADRDSLISMHGDPVLWNENNQITGEEIHIRTWDSQIDRLLVDRSGRIMSEALPERYNQITGRQITGFFFENDMNRILVSGNAESIYFPTEKQNEGERAIGLNKVTAGVIDIRLDKGELSEIRFKQEPVGSLKPNKDVSKGEMILPGFIWRDAERPSDANDVFRQVAPPAPQVAEEEEDDD